MTSVTTFSEKKLLTHSENAVTIITLTTNYDCLKLLSENIKSQNYNNIVEWVIINAENKLENNFNFPIKYVNSDYCDFEGDIIVKMNDDDFHFSSYISYCVDKLKNSNKLVAIANANYVHDIIIKKTYKIITEPKIMAFKKISFENSKKDLSLLLSVLENLKTSDSELLSCDHLMIKIINYNSNFKLFTVGGVFAKLDNVIKLEDEIIHYFITDYFYKQYQNIFIKEGELDYDIVYYSGGFGIVWDPSDKKLGGSEQAIVNLSENWIKQNKSVVVYGNFSSEVNYNGVEYKLWYNFPFEKKIKNLIAWRRHGIVPLMYINYKAEKLFIDFHDNFSYTLADLDKKLLTDLFRKSYKINLKSEYHKKSFEEFLSENMNEKYNIIINGVRINEFKNNTILNDNQIIIRNPYRFCYCSSYDRGLDYILTKIWPIIHKLEPRSELHVYYGMDYIYDDKFKNYMRLLLSQDGIIDHGRQPMDMIIREKYLSTFHLYLNNSIAEIDCISIRESLVTGCIPIISTFGVFKERHGLHYNLDDNHELIAIDICNKMKDFNYIENVRNQIMNSDTIVSWEIVAKKWIEDFN